MYYIGICDDEKAVCMQLADMVCAYDKRKNVGIEVCIWNTGEALYQDLMKRRPLDLLFLDIELASMNGIQVGRLIRTELANQEISIAYISAKSSYAIELFKIHPIDFLVKPICEQDVNDTIEEALRLYKRSNALFEYRACGYHCKISYKNIIYFYSENKKIHIVTPDSMIQFTGKIKELAEHVPQNFIQIHQSYLINMDHMYECSYETVKMRGGVLLNISQPYRKQVRKHLMDYAWGQDV